MGRKRIHPLPPENEPLPKEPEKDAFGFPMHELQCCYCRKQFVAHYIINGKAGCPHCGKDYLVMLHVCPECFDVLRSKDPRPHSPQPFRCPVCNGRGLIDDQPCHPCGGKGIVWSG